MRILNGLQGIITIAVLILFFQGKGAAGTFIAIWLALPLVRLLFQRSYRDWVKQFISKSWNEIEEYSKKHGPIPFKAAFALVGLPTLVLCLINGKSMPSLDTLPPLLAAASLVTDGNTDAMEFYEGRPCKSTDKIPYPLQCRDGKIYPSYPIGNVVQLLPFFAVSRIVGAKFKDGKPLWRLGKWVAAWSATACVVFIFLILLKLVRPSVALWTSVFLFTGSGMLSTVGQGQWSQGGVMLWFCLLCWIEFEELDRPWAVLIQAFAIATLMATRLNSATLVVPFWIWVFIRSPKRALIMGFSSLLFFAPWAIYHYTVSGTILGPHHTGQTSYFNLIPSLEAFAGQLVSPGRGLFVYQPWILFGLILLILALRKAKLKIPGPKGWAWVGVTSICLQLLMLSLWPFWAGGYCWGSRLMTETLLWFTLFAALGIDSYYSEKIKLRPMIAIAVLGFLINFTGVYGRGMDWGDHMEGYKSMEEKSWSFRDPPFLYPPF